MNVTTRTCANCAAFNAPRAINEPGCLNLVSFLISPGKRREPCPTDVCDSHQTHQEDEEQAAYIEANRAAIMGSIKAMAATQELLGKLRRGGAL